MERQPDVARQIAYDIADNPYSRARALCTVAGTLARQEPGQSMTLVSDAEKAVREMPASIGLRLSGLVEIAWALLDADPHRARRLLAEVQGIERPRGRWLDWDEYGRQLRMAETLAVLDPAEAQCLASDIGDGYPDALTAVAVVTAPRDPARAQSIAASISENGSRATALVHLAITQMGPYPDCLTW